MSREALKTLFHPFETGVLAAPGEGERVLFLGAEEGFRLPKDFAATLAAVQPHRGAYRRLEAQQVPVSADIPEGGFDAALILLGKHKGENENFLAEALTRVKTGGLIVLAGGKEDGIQPLRKKIERLNWGGDAMPKYHGVAVWFGRPADPAEVIAAMAAKPAVIDGRYTAAPGMFSHDRIDPGSELLASRLPTDFAGHAADFGAGWGYLSVALGQKSPGLKGIDLFEADYHALEAARTNVSSLIPKVATRFFWHDVTGEPVRDKYDLIVMNPPFHEAQAADPALGKEMIRAAAKSLKIGGRLLMVANRGLPYEPVLAEVLKDSGEICRNARFKVLWGKR